MRRYETIFITPEALPDENIREIAGKLEAAVQREGKVIRTDYWGRRTMAYEINKSRRGAYVLLDYVASPSIVAEAERTLQFNESVVRFHTIKIADDVSVDDVQPEESKPAPPDLFSDRPTEGYSNESHSDEDE